MTTPDSVKYAHTPSATDNVWGVGLKDAKRQSKWTARLDVGQSVTGLILGLFLFCHMAFTGSVNFGKDLFANLIATSGGMWLDGADHAWMHVLFVGFIFLCVIIHMFCALRRFPTSYKQLQGIRSHVKLVHHEDTTLWWFQFVTAFCLFFLVFPHLMSMLVNPHGFDPNLIGVHTAHNGYLYTFLFLVCTEIHGMVGLYRLAVKWDIFAKDPETKIMDQRAASERTGFRKIMLVVALLMIVGGSITMRTNILIGEEQIAQNAETQRYDQSAEYAKAAWYKEQK